MSLRQGIGVVDQTVGVPPLPMPRPAFGTAYPDRWVQPVSLTILALAILWSVLGAVGDNIGDGTSNATVIVDATKTADVNPYNSIVWLGLLAASMPVLIRRWREVAAVLRSSWMLLALFAYFLLSVGWALDPAASLRRNLAAIVQLALFATVVCGVRKAPALHVVLVGVCTAIACADLAWWVINPGAAMTEDGFAGLQAGKNQAGLVLMYGCLAAAPCIAYAMQRWLKALLVLAIMLIFGLLMVTRSSTSQSVTISAAILIPVLLKIAGQKKRTIQAIAAVFILALFTAFFVYLAWCGLTGTDEWAPLDGVTFTERLGIWQFVCSEISQRPWFGAGFGSFWSINPLVQPSLKTDQWFSLYTIINEGHQGYLDLWATTGFFGLLAGLLVIFRSIVIAAHALNRTLPAAAAWQVGLMGRPTAVFHFTFLLGLLVHNFTESGLFGSSSLLTQLLLITMLDLEKWRITA